MDERASMLFGTCVCAGPTELIEVNGETFWSCLRCGERLPSIDTLMNCVDELLETLDNVKRLS